MCGRYSITLPPEAIREIFPPHRELPNWPAYYNAAPTTALPVVRQAKDSSNRELVLMQWGLIPWFSKDGKPSYSTINARAEGLRTAASYKEPFAKGHRCIVPASGYFEWTGPKNDRQPHYFTRADGQPMGARWPVGSLAEQRQVGDQGDVHHHHNVTQQVRRSVARPHAAHPGAGHLGRLVDWRS